MKKKIIALTLGAFLLGSTVTFASSYSYYADVLAAQQPEMEENIEQLYKGRTETIGQEVYYEMVELIESEKNRVFEEAKTYLDEKMDQEQEDETKKYADEIRIEADRILEELKAKIDELTAE